MSINKFNSEGYYDPTAYEAMTAVESTAASPWTRGTSL